jgi:hypothetical protein
MKRNTYVVAVRGGSLCGQYAPKYVGGYYTTWNVRVTTDDEGPHVTSVRVRGVNVGQPSVRAIQNYTVLHEEGLI